MTRKPPEKITFNPADPEVIWILSQLCFQLSPIAHILQAAGHPIEKHAEDEQAAVMIWMLQKYQEHGAEWRDKVNEELKAMRAAAIQRATGGAEE